jgi:hypothetical protein
MKKVFFILTLTLLGTSCDYREYPQEQEWKETIKRPIQEMEKEKEKDPRHFDEESQKEEEQREVRADDLVPQKNENN